MPRGVPKTKPAVEGETPTEEAAELTRKRRVKIYERRFQNPFGEPSSNINFKDRSLEARWFNEVAKPGQIHRARELGWEPVVPAMIEDIEAIGFHSIDTSGYVVRGERGQEHLMYMPKAIREQIQIAKTSRNVGHMNNPNAQAREVVQAASTALGDEAASFLERNARVTVDVRTGTERIDPANPD